MNDRSPRAELFDFLSELADRLSTAADDLTDEWLEHLGERLGVRPRRLLPTKQLRDHVPDIIRGAASALALPTPTVPNETRDTVRTLAQLRREQGYDIQELLTEFDILSEIVFDHLEAWVEVLDAGAGETMEGARRLSGVLRSISTISVSTFREGELRNSRELAERLSNFASMLHHELANPLGVADMSAEMLTDEEVAKDPDQIRKHAERIRDRLERMHQLVTDVRTLAVAEGARAEPRWISIRQVVEDVFREVSSAAQRAGVELDAEPPDEDFEVDAVRVEIALMNLVSNAVKFCDPDKPERWVRVRIAPAESAGLAAGRRITVEDNGLGIGPEAQSRVFQRLFRERPGIEGTGLGLDIARRVVEQRGGRIRFESTLGEGTRFFMEIPQRLGRDEQEEHEIVR